MSTHDHPFFRLLVGAAALLTTAGLVACTDPAAGDDDDDTTDPYDTIPCLAGECAWEQVEGVGSGVYFSDIWGTGADDIHVLGHHGIYHYDGTEWYEPSHWPNFAYPEFWGTSQGEFWVTTDPCNTEQENCGAVVRVDDTSHEWELDTTQYFNDIWALSSQDVYAVGTSSIVHFDGQDWEEFDLGTRKQYAVFGFASNDVFVAGQQGEVFHFDGTSWEQMTTPTEGYLTALWGTSSSDLWAGGEDGIILHYDGDTWQQAAQLGCEIIDQLWGSGYEDVFAVGYDGMIAHYDGEDWTVQDSGTEMRLSAVWGSGSRDVYAAGVDTVLHYAPIAEE